MTLRLATMADHADCVRMAKAHWTQGPYKTIEFSERKVTERVTHFLQNQGPDYISILSCDGENPVGLIAAAALVPEFSDDRVGMEMIWWVDPEYRRSRRAIELMNAYEHWARYIAKCKTWHMALFETEDKELISKLYDRKGYTPTEQTFIKGV